MSMAVTMCARVPVSVSVSLPVSMSVHTSTHTHTHTHTRSLSLSLSLSLTHTHIQQATAQQTYKSTCPSPAAEMPELAHRGVGIRFHKRVQRDLYILIKRRIKVISMIQSNCACPTKCCSSYTCMISGNVWNCTPRVGIEKSDTQKARQKENEKEHDR